MLERQRFVPIGFYPRPGKLAGDLAAGRLKSTVRLRTDNIADRHYTVVREAGGSTWYPQVLSSGPLERSLIVATVNRKSSVVRIVAS